AGRIDRAARSRSEVHVRTTHHVMAGLVPAIPLRWAQCLPKRDARDKRGHDGGARLLRRPTWLALLAEAGPALLGLGGIESNLKLGLQLGDQLRRRRVAEPAQRALGACRRIGTGAQQLLDHAAGRGVELGRLAQRVDETDAQRLVSAEALARQQIAA